MRMTSLVIAGVGIWGVVAMLLIVSTTNGFAQSVASPTPSGSTATPLASAIGWDGFANNINPLTGLVVDDASILARRPLAIKISNAPAEVRPQAGIAQADIVYEHYVEGFLTRFTAIYYGNTPPYVGSVRSARLVDLQIPLMWQALFAFSGANGPTLLRLNESSFGDRLFINGGEPAFYREPSIEAPHNLFVVPSAIWAQATTLDINQRPQVSGLVFAEELPPDPVSFAERIVITYGPDEAEWVLDRETGQYNRFTGGQPHTDALDGQQVSASNVVVIWTHHQEDVTVVSSEWQGNVNYAFEMQIWTLGPATLFRDGFRYDGFWHRWDDELMLTFWRDDTMTERLYLKPGTTWFQIVPLDFMDLFVQAKISS